MTIQRNVRFIADRLGRPNSSLLFEHGFATVEPRGVYFNPATGFTVMFWIKPLSANYFFRFYRVFLNGSQVVERRDEYKYSMVPRGSNFVGANNWPSDELLHAELDELKIFDRPLSPDEIIQEMHKGQ